MRFAIGTLHVAGLPGRFVDSLLALKKPREGFDWLRLSGMPVDMARNEMVRRFLAGEAEWLLMVDSDMTFAPRSLERLASRRVDLVGGLCFTRYVPPLPAIFRGVTRVREDGREFLRIQCQETMGWLERHPEALERCPCVLDGAAEGDGMVRADATGGAFLLTHRRVFEAVGEPWFKRDELKKGEDFYFFEKVRRAGMELWIDRSVVVGHLWGDQQIGPEEFVAYQAVYPMERVIET